MTKPVNANTSGLDEFAQSAPPVRVIPPKRWGGNLGAFLELRRNLLSIWPESTYHGNSFQVRLLNQPYYICNTPADVRHFFLDAHDNYDPKSPQMRHALEPLLGDGLFISDGELWKERRAYCAPAFDAELLPAFTDIMVDCARQMAESWATQPADKPVDMLEEMGRLTSRIIGRTVFGDETSDEEAAQVIRGFAQYQKTVEQVSLADTFGLPQLRWLHNPWNRARTLHLATRVQAVIDGIIARHKARPPQRFTLLSLLSDGYTGRKDGERRCPLHVDAARNEAIVMFMAGHETTANSLTWTWYLLDSHPRVREKLQEELDRVLGDRLPSLDDVGQLSYTRAVFEEAMRLYPPVPLLTRQSRQDDELHGKRIPAGSIILVIPWLLHRHQAYWSYPDHFIPERFLQPYPRPDKYTYIPFSVGQRVCLGMRFGLTEGILCLATLARQFSAHVAPGHQVGIECRLTLRPKNGLPMILKPRSPLEDV